MTTQETREALERALYSFNDDGADCQIRGKLADAIDARIDARVRALATGAETSGRDEAHAQACPTCPPSPERSTLTFELHPTDDGELTCFVCSAQACDREIHYYADSRGSRRHAAMGLHSRCLLKPAAALPSVEPSPERDGPERQARAIIDACRITSPNDGMKGTAVSFGFEALHEALQGVIARHARELAASERIAEERRERAKRAETDNATLTAERERYFGRIAELEGALRGARTSLVIMRCGAKGRDADGLDMSVTDIDAALTPSAAKGEK